MTCKPNPADHYGLAHFVVNKYLQRAPWLRHLSDDLLSAALLGLCEAVDTFDANIASWSTYAGLYALGYIKREVAQQCRAVVIKRGHMVPPSLQVEDAEDKNKEVIEALEDKQISVEEQVQASEVREFLVLLNKRERAIIKRRFGIGTYKDETLQQIGDDLHLTRERIRQIEHKALQKMRRAARIYEKPGQNSNHH